MNQNPEQLARDNIDKQLLLCVRWNSLNLEDLFEMPFESKATERYSLNDDDLDICEGGEPGCDAIWKARVKV